MSMYASKRVMDLPLWIAFLSFRYVWIHLSFAMRWRVFHWAGVKKPSSFNAWMDSWRMVRTGLVESIAIRIRVSENAPSALFSIS